MPRETLQGTLDLLIFKTLARGSAHGYGITCAILNPSHNQLRVEEGSLYPRCAVSKPMASSKPNGRRQRTIVASVFVNSRARDANALRRLKKNGAHTPPLSKAFSN